MNKLLIRHILLITMVMGCLLFVTSCKVDNMYVESTKDITGTWKVIAATQNGNDLTKIPDNMTHLSTFSVTFGADNSYSMQSLIPFIASKAGTYAFNDSQYAMDVTFKPTTGTAVKSVLGYPVVQGVRQITLTFSPGCNKNVYVYTLKKTN